jgi:hypothetical protein
MIIEKVDSSREAFSDYSHEEAILTIGGIEVELAAEQGDQEAVITFAICDGKVRRGMMPCCEYVADVIIPPRRYELVEVEGPGSGTAGSGDFNDEDEEAATRTESVPVPLDPDSVTLRLWPVTARGEKEEQGVMSC